VELQPAPHRRSHPGRFEGQDLCRGRAGYRKFDMDVKPVSLTAADVSGLLVVIAKDPGYAVPKRVKPRPPKRDHPATFLDRGRARREKRRARWRTSSIA
jgi:hypothetical protein